MNSTRSGVGSYRRAKSPNIVRTPEEQAAVAAQLERINARHPAVSQEDSLAGLGGYDLLADGEEFVAVRGVAVPIGSLRGYRTTGFFWPTSTASPCEIYTKPMQKEAP